MCVSDCLVFTLSGGRLVNVGRLRDLAAALHTPLCARYCTQGHHLAAASSGQAASKPTQRSIFREENERSLPGVLPVLPQHYRQNTLHLYSSERMN